MKWHTENKRRCLTRYFHENTEQLKKECLSFVLVSQFSVGFYEEVPIEFVLKHRVVREPKCSAGCWLFGLKNGEAHRIEGLIDSSD